MWQVCIHQRNCPPSPGARAQFYRYGVDIGGCLPALRFSRCSMLFLVLLKVLVVCSYVKLVSMYHTIFLSGCLNKCRWLSSQKKIRFLEAGTSCDWFSATTPPPPKSYVLLLYITKGTQGAILVQWCLLVLYAGHTHTVLCAHQCINNCCYHKY